MHNLVFLFLFGMHDNYAIIFSIQEILSSEMHLDYVAVLIKSYSQSIFPFCYMVNFGFGFKLISILHALTKFLFILTSLNVHDEFDQANKYNGKNNQQETEPKANLTNTTTKK